MLYVVKTFVRQIMFKIVVVSVMMILVSLPYALCGEDLCETNKFLR